MAIWDKVKQELDRAGRVAQGALDEGKIRLEAFRVRQLADKTAQALGYAVFHARRDGRELEPDTLERLTATLATHEAEAAQLEAQLAAFAQKRRPAGPPPRADAPSPPRPPEPPEPLASDASGPTPTEG